MAEPVAASSRLKLTLAAERIPAQSVTVDSLGAAVAAVRDFVRRHDLCASEYGAAAGRIERDGVPYCRVSFYGRIWKLDEQGRECYREMNLSGEVAP